MDDCPNNRLDDASRPPAAFIGAFNNAIALLCTGDGEPFDKVMTDALYMVADASDTDSIAIFRREGADLDFNFKLIYRWDRCESGDKGAGILTDGAPDAIWLETLLESGGMTEA